MSTTRTTIVPEAEASSANGFAGLLISLALLALAAWCVATARGNVGHIFAGAGLLIAGLLGVCGLYTLQPGQAAVLLLFGEYRGTDRRQGLRWTNPFRSRKKISLRAHNLNSDKIKVNDKRGNPIEIAAVIVWRVEDTAQASFAVENYGDYVRMQSDAAIRHLANSYAYDEGEEHDSAPAEITLRSGVEEVGAALTRELEARLAPAGLRIDEARLSHLAYAPEIAGAMLRRQQAEAVIAARKKIVLGAVTMVEMALAGLSERNVVQLDDERKAAMISNLMVVLCGESDARPVINTGTLYS